QNALKFNGKANIGAVIGSTIAAHPELKENTKEVAKAASEIVNEVNSLTLNQQLKELQESAPELLEKKEKKKKELPELKNAEEGKVVTRLPPEPSKHLHIGHALSFLINYMYAVKYKGKCILRMEDTNPENAGKFRYSPIYSCYRSDGRLFQSKISKCHRGMPE
ncbi:MAG: glutamate--tRNA ligase family protein, partial [Promethearchaeota archaeon]